MAGIQYEKNFDVLVAGGGVAGIGAALAASRAGARVGLIEKTILPGGLATAGNVFVYLPLSDSRGRQVTFGLAEELLDTALKYGPGDIPADWRDPATSSRYGSRFSPASFILALDEVLLEAGVELWFDTLICESVVKGDRIVGVEVENKSGRGLLTAGCLIDATGDADVAFRAGAPCAEQDNFLSLWALGASLEAAQQAVRENDGTPLMHRIVLGGSDTGAGHPKGIRKFRGTDGKEVSEFVIQSRGLIREYYQIERGKAGAEGRKNTFPLTLPAMADFRTTRRIVGQSQLDDGQMATHFDDCVGLVADWRGGRDVWEVPYGTLVPQRIKGLLAAGRCMASAGQAWEVMRVIQAAVMTGEVCGLAAATAVRLDTTPDALEVGDLQRELRERGFLLDVTELG